MIRKQGFALVTVLTLMLVLAALISAYFALTSIEISTTESSVSSTSAFYSAEAGLNLRGQEIRQTFVGFNRPAGISPTDYTECLDASATNDGLGDFACRSLSFGGKTVETYVEEAPGNPTTLIIPPGERFQGLQAQEYEYTAWSVGLSRDNLPEAILGLTFRSRLVPLFQFAAFYDKDLEIANGPGLILSGPIHVNGDLYLNTGSTQDDLGQVTAARVATNSPDGGNLFRGLKRSNSCSGTVRVATTTGVTTTDINNGNFSNMRQLKCSDAPNAWTAIDSTFLTSNWNGMIQVGTDYVEVPDTDQLDYTGVYWNKADLRIGLNITDPDEPVIEVYQQALSPTGQPQVDLPRTLLLQACTYQALGLGTPTTPYDYNENDFLNAGAADDNGSSFNDVLLGYDGGGSKVALPLPTGTGDAARRHVVEASNTFYNNREIRSGNTVNGTTKNYDTGDDSRTVMLEVDVQGLMACIDNDPDLLGAGSAGSGPGLTDTTEGGLVWYLTVVGPLSGDCPVLSGTPCINNYGVRVYNGAQLAASTPGAPPIRGLTIASDQALYSQGDYNRDSFGGDVWKPAAFLADSYNLLSNAWRDANGGNNVKPDANTSYVNVALLSGTDITNDQEGPGGQGGGNTFYNGGLENYPRFHERWSGVTLRYRGSFVSLAPPNHVHGRWNKQVYNPPKRDWGFDERFRDAANLPPLSPRFVYLKQQLFERSYDQAGP